MTFTDIIANAMKGRGKMRIADVYKRVLKEAEKEGWPLNDAWEASVRKQMQKHCKRSQSFCGEERFIYHQKAIWEYKK